jgi:hypothetical protein
MARIYPPNQRSKALGPTKVTAVQMIHRQLPAQPRHKAVRTKTWFRDSRKLSDTSHKALQESRNGDQRQTGARFIVFYESLKPLGRGRDSGGHRNIRSLKLRRWGACCASRRPLARMPENKAVLQVRRATVQLLQLRSCIRMCASHEYFTFHGLFSDTRPPLNSRIVCMYVITFRIRMDGPDNSSVVWYLVRTKGSRQ